MLSKELGAERAKRIDPEHAACQVVPSQISERLNSTGSETIYMSTIDKDGNIAMSFSTSGMYRARVGADGQPVVEIYKD